jgi:hypothetical protein
MTTIAFVPNNSVAPPFSAIVTLDGAAYHLTVAWNFYRGDWLVSLADQNGNRVMTMPLVASPQGANIFLFPGVFQTSTILYRESTGNFEIGP